MATPKGAARREALVAAAAALVAADGPDAVSHRAVAAAAGVPLAATTYYFRDLDDMLVAAVERAAAAELTAAEAVVAATTRSRRGVRETATLVTDVLLGARRADADLQAHYERWFAGGRHPAVRPVLRATRARLDELVAELLARGEHREVPVVTVVALVDGTALSALVEGEGQARAAAETALADLLSRRRRW